MEGLISQLPHHKKTFIHFTQFTRLISLLYYNNIIFLQLSERDA